MANIFSTLTPRYLSSDELKDSTTYPDILTLSDEVLNQYIFNTERSVDNYLGYSFDDFLNEDTDTQLAVKSAVLYGVEYYLTIEAKEKASYTSMTEGTTFIKKETSGDTSYEYGSKAIAVSTTFLPEKSKLVLEGYKLICLSFPN